MRKILLVLLIVAVQQVYATEWYRPSAENVLGRWWQGEKGQIFNRFPDRFKDRLTPDVWYLSNNSAGLYIKFETDSRNVVVRYKLTSGSLDMWHMPSTGVSGVDLYITDEGGQERWCSSSSRSFADTVYFKYTAMEYGQKAIFTLYLPLYNGVKSLEIGVDSGSCFSFVGDSHANPIVLYGTSIAQGACASRPGLAWSNIMQRRMRYPIINFGFSGNGLLHDAIFEAMAEIPAAAYIIDCMPNMTEPSRVDSIFQRVVRGVDILRKNGSMPILLVEHDGYMNENVVPSQKEIVKNVNRKLRDVYDYLVSKGYSEVYYVTKEDIGMDDDCQVDGCHANDIGMFRYADAYERLLGKIFCKY